MKKILTLLALAFCLNTHAQIITTVVGYSVGLSNPNGLAFDAAGNLYIADTQNSWIRKLNTAGIITIVAGTGGPNFSGDGGQATAASLNYPQGLAIDAIGNLYIADYGNNRIRKVNTAGIITTIAGTGSNSYTGVNGPATAADLSEPYGVICDLIGNIYIADGASGRVLKVDTTGILKIFAGVNGVSGCSGDGGQATLAQLGAPTSLCFDAIGNLYINDYRNNQVRKVNTSGIITTIVGVGAVSGTGTYSGDGGQATAARLNQPWGITLDHFSNIYISDTYNNRIRMVNSQGIITTVAGIGVAGIGGDGGQATAASLSFPQGVICDVSGNLFISESQGSDVRKVTNPCSISVSYTLAQAAPQTWDASPNYSTNVTSATWYWGDGSSTNGLYPSHTYSVAGKYNICVTAFSSCGNSVSSCQNDSIYRYSNNSTLSNMVYVNVINNATTDIKNTSVNNSANIYPNPSSTNFVIETNSNDKQTLQVFDVNGKLVLTQSINGKTNIDASHLAEGVYNLSLQNASGVVNKRLIIVR